jgi:hypothetical protein
LLPKVDEIGLKILFLLIPGIIAFFLVKSLGPKRPRTDFESGLQIFLYGIASYAITGFLEGLYVWWTAVPDHRAFFQLIGENTLGLATLKPDMGLSAVQIYFSTIVAVALGCVIAVLQTHSIPHRILRALYVTKRVSEADVWGFTFNSPDIDSWVTVRHPNGKVYQGWVRGYSEGADERELVLAEVTVYVAAAEGEPDELIEVDNIPVLYLGLDKKSVVIELRQTSQSIIAETQRNASDG